MSELMSIGEFAGVCQLSVKTLRYYHEIGLLEPAVVDPATGYRYYRFDQGADATAIAALRRLDMPLAEVQEIIHGPDRARAHSLIQRHHRRLKDRLADAEQQLTNI